MTLNKEELINKILYRSSYRGSKEMDLLMKSFVKSIIYHSHLDDLKKLNDLVNLDDEKLIEIRNSSVKNYTSQKNNIIIQFIKFKH